MDAITTRLLCSTLVGFCGVNDRMRIGTDGSADGHELCNVESPLSKLKLGHDALIALQKMLPFCSQNAGGIVGEKEWAASG